MRLAVRRLAVGVGVMLGIARLSAGCAGGNETDAASSGDASGPTSGEGASGGAATGTGGASTSTSSTSASSSAAGGATTGTGGGGGGGGGPGGASSASTASSATSASSTGAGGDGGACAAVTTEAELAPAAMLVVLDKSASMNNSNKWSTSQLAVVSAVDKDVFDTMSLGLVTFPVSYANPPACLCDFYGFDQATCNLLLAPGVSCGVSGLPQIALAPAGMNKSNAASGVRHDIYQYLVNNNPLSNSDDGSPIYDALSSGYAALKAYNIDKRILVLITDGGFSCTSLASPARPGYTDGACLDWEYPDSVNTLITQARTDPSAPIFTFVVGVPGSNSTGANIGGFATPPYKMLLALSTYAVSGSPATVDPACDSAAVFTQNGAAPAVPCHVDLSNGAMFDANALANAIAAIRLKALGCVYDLPPPPPNMVIDLTKVNVQVTVNAVTTVILKRVDPLDQCLIDGCWDYNAQGQVELIGKTCSDVSASPTAKVEISVGCDTLHK